MKIKIPTRFTAFFTFALSNALFLALLRVIFYFINRPEQPLNPKWVYEAFSVGLRFDLRVAFLFSLPLGLMFLLPYKKFLRPLISIIYALAFTLMLFIYFVDFGYWSYLGERLNSYIIELAANGTTSFEMVWQSYPVTVSALALLAAFFAFFLFTKKVVGFAYSRTAAKKQYWYVLPALLITAAFIHGRFSQYPLRWSNAYFTNNSFITALSLNPLQNLVDTYTFALQGQGFDENKTRLFYKAAADYLGVKEPNENTLNFSRHFPEKEGGAKKYNIVIIITESLSFDKTSFAVPQIDATPYIAGLAKQGTLFTNFYTPAAGTAKGVFATVAGLVDTSTVKTSSRNPMIVTQHSLLNDLEGYRRMYFIGGSTNWGNIRGLLQHNIEGLEIFEEGSYGALSRTDVWGISDLDMFRFAAKELNKSSQPFAAILQTAGFHRPYTIPKDRGTFELKDIDEEEIKTYGFSGKEEYNSMRFQDYATGEFFNLIKDDDFYKNTIFFIYGDHGLTVNTSRGTSKASLDFELTTNHTPLIVFGPNVPQGITDEMAASQADITATAAGLLGIEHTQTAIGKNIFDKNQGPRGAFILNNTSAPLKIGYLEGDYYFTLWPNKTGLFKYKTGDSQTDYCAQNAELCARMKETAQGLYESARYITFHHKIPDETTNGELL